MIVSDAQILLGNFCDKEDRLDTRNKFKKFWSASIRPLWSILKLKYPTQAHWFTELECWMKTKILLLILRLLIILIFKVLPVCGEKFQDTLLFKPSKDLIESSIAQRRSINLLTRRIHGIDWISGFYPYSFVNQYFVSLLIRFSKVTIFVKGKNRAQFIPKYLENVRDLEDFGCPRMKKYEKIL